MPVEAACAFGGGVGSGAQPARRAGEVVDGVGGEVVVGEVPDGAEQLGAGGDLGEVHAGRVGVARENSPQGHQATTPLFWSA